MYREHNNVFFYACQAGWLNLLFGIQMWTSAVTASCRILKPRIFQIHLVESLVSVEVVTTESGANVYIRVPFKPQEITAAIKTLVETVPNAG